MSRYIDADELKAKFCNHCDERDCKPDATDTVYGCVIADTIDSIPTIEVEPVKYGRWDRHGVVKILCSGEMLDGFCQCENCGDVFPHQFAEYAYCPNCGARMEGGTNNEKS